jgi:hypothetical protein
MSPVKFCPDHGPYDASFATCPQCGGQPSAPRALDEMDVLETDITPAPRRFNDDADETYIPAERGLNQPMTDATMLSSDSARAMDETQLSGSRSAMMEAIFWVKEGNRRGKYYPIRHNTVIGRKEGNLILDDLKVSATHAKITFSSKKYMIWDFGSANGTFVNGKRITEAKAIDENDEIRIGDTVFVLKLLSGKKKKPTLTAEKKKTRATSSQKSSKTSTTRKSSGNDTAQK